MEAFKVAERSTLINSLQDMIKEFDMLDQDLRSSINLFPTFLNAVTSVQRRTVRRWCLEHLEKLRTEINAALSQAATVELSKAFSGVLEDGFMAFTGVDVRSKERRNEAVWVQLTTEGVLSVTRSCYSSGILMDRSKFKHYIDEIRDSIIHDPIDVDTSPEDIVKTYLIRFCEEEKRKLPVFGKAPNKSGSS